MWCSPGAIFHTNSVFSIISLFVSTFESLCAKSNQNHRAFNWIAKDAGSNSSTSAQNYCYSAKQSCLHNNSNLFSDYCDIWCRSKYLNEWWKAICAQNSIGLSSTNCGDERQKENKLHELFRWGFEHVRICLHIVHVSLVHSVNSICVRCDFSCYRELCVIFKIKVDVSIFSLLFFVFVLYLFSPRSAFGMTFGDRVCSECYDEIE